MVVYIAVHTALCATVLHPGPSHPPTHLRSPLPLHPPAGGTLIECQRLLATQGAAHVSAYVTHGVFPNESWRRFEGENGTGATDGFRWVGGGWDSCSCTGLHCTALHCIPRALR